MTARLVYTRTDEAPLLATYAFLPILRAYARAANVSIELADISLATRILAAVAEHLPEEQRVPDALAELGNLATQPDGIIVKLPNISASMPQLEAAIAELQAAGYAVPSYPKSLDTDEDKAIAAAYDKVKGSAVNPVLREGNSDRRAPDAVKAATRVHPHSMGKWTAQSKTAVMTMTEGDFYHNEQSVTVPEATTVRFVHTATDGTVTTLRGDLPLLAGEIIDATVMSAKALRSFIFEAIKRARQEDVLFSVHLKATMMKVSDPLIFGHVVHAYFADVYEHHFDALQQAGITPSAGLAALETALASMDEAEAKTIEVDIKTTLANGPRLAMVNSNAGTPGIGITNLHVPSDVIIDASMPAMIRNGGKMWNIDNAEEDTLAVIPDSSYAKVYDVVIKDCIANGALDPTTMGTVPNVGLMAQKAEEYGSHDKTFEIQADGVVTLVDAEGRELTRHEVQAGDIWRACQTKDAPVTDWVQLAVRRAQATGWPAIFWLDADRAHDAELIKKINAVLPTLDTTGADIRIMDVAEATQESITRARQGENTISCTGNVLRDYLTDLFPILELGTSAKMLSIVPLMNGGGLYETGAGGSAPKHVQQLVKENHLRWDSLGEYLALTPALEHVATLYDNAQAKVLADTLNTAVTRYLQDGHNPSRKAGEQDNRSAHFWVALEWAKALAEQPGDPALAEHFRPIYNDLETNQAAILEDFISPQGTPADLGGYYVLNDAKTERVMRPSAVFNSIIDSL